MNDFLLTEIAREYQARVAKQAEAARLVHAAEGAGTNGRRRVRRLWTRPRNG